MPRSIEVLTSSSAPAWPTVLMALKRPLPSPNVMVPKQSFETRRPVLPSVAYSMAYSFLVEPKSHWREGVGRWYGRACPSSWQELWILLEAPGRSGGAVDTERDRQANFGRRQALLNSDQALTALCYRSAAVVPGWSGRR